MRSEEFDRVVVVGTSGAGKTTFSRALAQRLASPHVELDSLFWLPNWTARDLEPFRALVSKSIAGPKWVADGNYNMVRDLMWQRATAIVWLNYSFTTVFSRALRRTVARVIDKQPTHAGNIETFRHSFLSRDGIPGWVIRTFWQRRKAYGQLLKSSECAHARVVIFTRPSEAQRFLEEMPRNGTTGP